MGAGVFPGVKSGRDLMLNPHPLLVPLVMKEKAIPLLPLLAERPVQNLSACTRMHFNFFYAECTLMGTINFVYEESKLDKMLFKGDTSDAPY
jgi:hypothetical protein